MWNSRCPTLARFGVDVHTDNGAYRVPGGQTYFSPGTVRVDGDWSNAAFFLVAGAVGEKMTVTGLDLHSLQGDQEIVNILRKFGAKTQISAGAVTVSPGKLRGCNIDISGIPDLLPVLAVLATAAEGETRFVNAARLRLKESDRLESTAAMLQALGGEVTVFADGLSIRGGRLLGGQRGQLSRITASPWLPPWPLFVVPAL